MCRAKRSFRPSLHVSMSSTLDEKYIKHQGNWQLMISPVGKRDYNNRPQIRFQINGKAAPSKTNNTQKCTGQLNFRWSVGSCSFGPPVKQAAECCALVISRSYYYNCRVILIAADHKGLTSVHRSPRWCVYDICTSSSSLCHVPHIATYLVTSVDRSPPFCDRKRTRPTIRCKLR